MTTKEYIRGLAVRMNSRVAASKQECEMYLYLSHFGDKARSQEYLLKAHEQRGAMEELTSIHKELVDSLTRFADDTR